MLNSALESVESAEPGPPRLCLGYPIWSAMLWRAARWGVLRQVNFNSPNAMVFTPFGVSPTAGVITGTSALKLISQAQRT